MRHFMLVILMLALVVVGGCAGLSPTEQTTLTGGAAGAAGGALIGAIAGNAGLGAAIGGGAGLLGGFLYGEHQQSVHEAYERGVQQGYRQAP
jgi:osmotically inducible lipoprotein OsmB